MKIIGGSHMNLTFIGSGIKDVKIDCPNEAFSISGSKVTLPGATDKNDCLYKSMKEYDIELKKVTYSSHDDEFTVKVVVLKIITITSHLYHDGEVEKDHWLLDISFEDIKYI